MRKCTVNGRVALIGCKVGYRILVTSTSTLLQGNGKMKVINRWIMGCGDGGR